MNCECCCQNDKSAFANARCLFTCSRDLTIFLVNVVLNLKKKIIIVTVNCLENALSAS